MALSGGCGDMVIVWREERLVKQLYYRMKLYKYLYSMYYSTTRSGLLSIFKGSRYGL